MKQGLRCAVAGAGIAGLAAAAFLAKDGHQVDVFEKRPQLTPLGAGLLLQPTGLMALNNLGLLPCILKAGSPITRLAGQTAGSNAKAVFNLSYARLAPGLHGLGIHRARLYESLRAAVSAFENVVLTTEAEATGLDEDASGKPWLRLGSREKRGPYDLLVDASGVRSALRPGNAPVRLDKPYPYGALYGVCEDRDGAFPAHALTQRYRRAREMAGVLPLGAGPGGLPEVAFFWSLPVNAYAVWQTEGLEAWKTKVLQLWPETTCLIEQLTAPGRLIFATYRDVVLRCWHKGRVAWIGDAGHCTSPQLGQGANLSLLDAMTLAAVLREESSVPQALKAFSAERRGPLRYYQAASRLLTPFFQSDSVMIPWLRDRLFDSMAAIPWVERQMLQTLAGMKTGAFSVCSLPV